jgi:hypothetical protein
MYGITIKIILNTIIIYLQIIIEKLKKVDLQALLTFLASNAQIIRFLLNLYLEIRNTCSQETGCGQSKQDAEIINSYPFSYINYFCISLNGTFCKAS